MVDICDRNYRSEHAVQATRYFNCTFNKAVINYGTEVSFVNCIFHGDLKSDFRNSRFIDCIFMGQRLQGTFDDCDFTGSTFQQVLFAGANISGAKGLLSQADFMSQFETDRYGVIVYKSFADNYPVPKYWEIKRGSVIEEAVNPDRSEPCGCGINFATALWVHQNTDSRPVWKCRIEWKDLAGVVVPYRSDGKARCERVTLVSKLSEATFSALVRKEREKKQKD